ncbi:MAG TPA: M20 family metallo-hydrolase [Xanthobacteraceae bacterium]|nr:M20 family metallo-hydrolase [Xanthobacteraceae bacterium]
MPPLPNLRIDGARLWGELMETAAFGATAKGGINRLTLTDLDRQVRDWFKSRAEKLGCTVTVDSMGAMFARRAGRADVPPIAMGSHLDTQPTGGKFDGVLGVLGALEALRTLVEAGYETFAPIEVINWTNEEGARFQPSMVASGVFAGAFEHDWAAGRRDAAGTTFGEALAAIGYRGPQPCGMHPLSAFFELHIEQGPILEAEDKAIGIVTGIQGIRWFEATIRGEDRHTGTTPMGLRKNALLGAARLVERVDAIARAHAPQAVGTVGRLEVKPNSPNVVPGEVFFTVDLRHPEDAVLDEMQAAWTAAGYALTEELGLEVEIAKILDQPPVRFDADCIACVRESARAAGLAAREMVSGAGHDAGYVSRVAPAAMVFVPCRGGISHNEAEYSAPEHCSAGAQVLLQAVLGYDRLLEERLRPSARTA